MPFLPPIIELREIGAEAPYRWLLFADLEYQAAPDRDAVTVVAPFQTDLASVPRLLTWLIPRYGLYTKAAVVHDYLCQNAPDRFAADAVFLEAMSELEVPRLRKRLMWAAVSWATVGGHLLRRWAWTLFALTGVVLLAVFVVPPFGGWWLVAWIVLLIATSGGLAALVVSVPDGALRRVPIVLRATGWTIVGLPLLVPALPLAVVLGAYLVVESPGGAWRSLVRWMSAPFRMLARGPVRAETEPAVVTPRERRLANLVRDDGAGSGG